MASRIGRSLLRSGIHVSQEARPIVLSHLLSPSGGVCWRSCHGLGEAQEALPADEIKRRIVNRVLYRSRQRGYLELDLILGKWAQDNVPGLDDAQLEGAGQLLDAENPDLWKWVTGQEEPPPSVAINPVFSAIKHYVSEKLLMFSATETRAAPGLPWVRGWDDNRKLGGPQAGNQ